MTPQENELITTLLTRLKGAAAQPKDAEADAMIRQALAEQPDAPYYLVQTALIQDLSLHAAQKRITDLEQQVVAAQQAAAKPASTGFLGGLFGSSQPAAPPPPQPMAPAPGPWSRAPQPMAPPPSYGAPQGYGAAPQAGAAAGGFLGSGTGGGFLRSAAATAAGVAGGALLFEGISSMFGHHYSSSLMGNQAGIMPGVGETVVNNYYGDGGAGSGQDYGSSGGQDYGSSGSQDYGSSGGDQDYGSSGGSDQDYGSSGGSDSSSSC